VIFDAQIFSAQEYGGISRYFCEITQSLSVEKRISARLIAPLYINAYVAKLNQNLVIGFSCPHFLKAIKSKWIKMLRRILGLGIGDLALRIYRPDIIHETYYSPVGFGASRAKRVLTIYDMIHEKFADQFSPSDKTARYKAIAARRADHVICISESTRNDVINLLHLDPSKVSVTYLGFSALGKASLSLAAIDGVVRPYILFVGNRAGYKNFNALLIAYAKSDLLRDKFQLVCFGGGHFSELEQTEIARLGLKNQDVLHFSGDDQRLSQFYSQAQAFVYPSLYEGFGIPPLEAMANHCPVICSNTSSIPEVVADAGEYFNPYDACSLQLAIERVVSSPLKMDGLRKAGQERLKYFSWDRCAQETLNIYKKLL
jgi:glycosyltransferase involved in cell wall biosynthesis